MSEQEARAWQQDWDIRNEVIQEARLVRNETQRNALLEAYQKARMKLLVHGDRSALEQVLADVRHAREETKRRADAYDGVVAQRDARLEVLKKLTTATDIQSYGAALHDARAAIAAVEGEMK